MKSGLDSFINDLAPAIFLIEKLIVGVTAKLEAAQLTWVSFRCGKNLKICCENIDEHKMRSRHVIMGEQGDDADGADCFVQ